MHAAYDDASTILFTNDLLGIARCVRAAPRRGHGCSFTRSRHPNCFDLTSIRLLHLNIYFFNCIVMIKNLWVRKKKKEPFYYSLVLSKSFIKKAPFKVSKFPKHFLRNANVYLTFVSYWAFLCEHRYRLSITSQPSCGIYNLRQCY